ncbi:MAG: flagellar biosynthesis protein FlhB [Roseburia sp.]|nr:flagellar biosynthesis protein FlhB [Roseburia sp.]
MLAYNLQFFAKDGEGGEKTEDATPKKLADARKEGQVAKSHDLGVAVLLIVLFVSLKIFGGFMYGRFTTIFRFYMGNISDYAFDFNTLRAMNLLVIGGREILLIAGPIFALAVLGAFVINVVQVKWKPTLKPLRPKFNKFNPVSGVKRLFSKDKIFELIKAIAKLAVLFYVVYSSLKDEWGLVVNIYQLELTPALLLIVDTIMNVGFKICAVFSILAIVDYVYQKRKFKKDMKMTKQEVKDEYKNAEGNPQTKSRIRSKMQEASRRRMMQSVPEADVVITNPTHLAVALKYDKSLGDAPVVLAKGADYLAARIKDVAKENKVEIVENKPLARMLYYNVEIGAQIPPELYQMVAEILAYVYNLQGKL